jgi:hypothetical protein
MSSSIAHSLDALAQWRAALDGEVTALAQELQGQDLLGDADLSLLASLRQRLASDKLVLAFVAEFSRGKSELINAIFFADAGRRVLPATPGRTTMCPVELRWEPHLPPRLALLSIETRLHGLALAELRPREEHWEQVLLDPQDPASLVQALSAVTRTQRVTQAQAMALGFWDESEPDDNPPQAADGTVEVPAWRHAIINYPHPLLKRGLVVIDTPGLNAVGAEPELTLGLLPSAHAVVFVLAADTGVTKSDLSMWRDHLGSLNLERFVVLNKIDALADPLLSPAEVQLQIEKQRLSAAQVLGVDPQRVFALSAREALAARIDGNANQMVASRLPPLEAALAGQLLPRRQELLAQATAEGVERLRASAQRRLTDRQRQHAEQLLELRGLRGKSGTKLRMLVERVDAEVLDFERCAARLAALRAVHVRMHKAVLAPMTTDALRSAVVAMQTEMGSRLFNLGGRAAFERLMLGLRQDLARAGAQAEEMRQMLQGSFEQLNTEFGFAFVVGPVPRLDLFAEELAQIEDSYGRYLGLGQAWRMAAPGFSEQFRRMLMGKVRVVFENAVRGLELWSKGAQAQVEVQLVDRRRGFAKRRESLQRVQSAAGELEQRIAEVQGLDEQVTAGLARIQALAAQALAGTRRAAAPDEARDPERAAPRGVPPAPLPIAQHQVAA